MKALQPHADSETSTGSYRSTSRRRCRALGLIVAALAGCAEQKAPSATASGTPEIATSGSAGSAASGAPPASAALAERGGASAGAARTIQRNGLVWYEDAPDAAFAAARAAGRRVVIDLWAPWCHTCLSMQNFVLTA